MNDLLTLQVKDGPQIGQGIPVTTDKTSLGGKGSGSDIELSGVPHGVQFAEVRVMSGKWVIVEYQPRSILLNGRQLKRKNILKAGDVISFPSLNKGQSIRFEVALEAQKKQKEEEKTGSGIKPIYLAGGVLYLVLFLLGALYFMLNGSNNDAQSGILKMADVASALDTDIASINNETSVVLDNIALADTPVNFEELKKFLISSIQPERKQAIKKDFKARIMKLFSEAWRFEQQKRWVDAKTQYEMIVTTMDDRDLATTNIALKRMHDLN